MPDDSVPPASVSGIAAATRVQRMERGRQARSLRQLAPPFTPQQRRQLEDALSAAVSTAMGLAEHSERLGFIARHIVARNDGRTPPEAPPRNGKLGEGQAKELSILMSAIHRAVNASNCKAGNPLRNVAEHLFSQHRSSQIPKPPARPVDSPLALAAPGQRSSASQSGSNIRNQRFTI